MAKMTKGQKEMLYHHLYHLITTAETVPAQVWRTTTKIDPMFKPWVNAYTPMIFKNVIRCLQVDITIQQADGSEKIYRRRFIAQNKSLTSKAAKRARDGAKIVQIYQNNNWIDKIEDGVIHSFWMKNRT